jgi:hypothetical protein
LNTLETTSKKLEEIAVLEAERKKKKDEKYATVDPNNVGKRIFKITEFSPLPMPQNQRIMQVEMLLQTLKAMQAPRVMQMPVRMQMLVIPQVQKQLQKENQVKKPLLWHRRMLQKLVYIVKLF